MAPLVPELSEQKRGMFIEVDIVDGQTFYITSDENKRNISVALYRSFGNFPVLSIPSGISNLRFIPRARSERLARKAKPSREMLRLVLRCKETVSKKQRGFCQKEYLTWQLPIFVAYFVAVDSIGR